MTPTELCRALIDECEPASLLACGPSACQVAERWHADHPDRQLRELAADTRLLEGEYAAPHHLALLESVFDEGEAEPASLLLGQLRNYGNHQIAVLIRNDGALGFNDFLALGFVRQTTIEPGSGHPGHTLYTYNINTYNHKRSWNNPQYWANPEMWGKAWW